MKLISTLVAFTVMGLPLCAQPNTVTTPPCNDEWCKQAEYNYQFCDTRTGLRVDKCSSDPNNEPFLKVMKRALPLALCPDFYTTGLFDKVVFASSPDPLDPHDMPVFINNHMVDRLQEAAAAWQHLCPQQGPNGEYDGSCCLLVRWSLENRELGDYYKGAAAVTRIVKYGADPLEGNCRTYCAGSFIVVNQQPDHTGFDERSRPKFFVYTEPTPWAFIPADRGYSYIDAYSMFAHELGHWLGFNHSENPGDNGSTCYHQSIMDASGYPLAWALERRELTTDDACMFKKLYCCESTKRTSGVDDAKGPALSFVVVPNPARSSLTLRLPANLPRAGGLTVRIVDVTGNTVHELHLREPAVVIPVDLEGIAEGVYMLTVTSGARTYGEKIIVQR